MLSTPDLPSPSLYLAFPAPAPFRLASFSSLHTAAPLPLGRACLYTGYPCTPLLMSKISGIFA